MRDEEGDTGLMALRDKYITRLKRELDEAHNEIENLRNEVNHLNNRITDLTSDLTTK